jgi:hypothetical protein
MNNDDPGTVSDPDIYTSKKVLTNHSCVGLNPKHPIFTVSPDRVLTYYNQDGKTIFSIRQDGNIEIGDGIELTEASRCFWEMVNFMKGLTAQNFPLR